ncbi:DUF5391 domain-containing protein [Clostridium coskatii]|uniref:Uncharacterized protein n=1 Tax=Clostridium coskatii TaxID=1705578 RepID=A0A170NNE1_9CLOT|nr:DUF5391 domain-containing protein [Clostridium coskatii]OAA93287.1 hypothetical protein WX73_00239 [Clostridium coskatii]OBR95330.1 hypothetical protein CLCOS_16540 [Clostridium coskatii]
MIEQKNKYKVIFITLVSAVLFCSLIVISSLSPLTNSGPNANKFNSFGMWLSVGIVLLLYIVPLIIYILGIRAVRFVMAFVLAVGILSDFSLTTVVFMSSLFAKNLLYTLIGVICIVSLIVNAIWFLVVFRSSSK